MVPRENRRAQYWCSQPDYVRVGAALESAYARQASTSAVQVVTPQFPQLPNPTPSTGPARDGQRTDNRRQTLMAIGLRCQNLL